MAAATQLFLRRVETDDGALALLTIDNGADWRTPTFLGREALESLARALEAVESQEWAALVVTGKPFVFCAGADVTEFPGITPELARRGSRTGHELFGRIRALPFPTVAAVNGACLGGGVELALHCDVRTAAASVRHLALPEVFLGLFPAWGGTQLLPRLVGVDAAIEVIVQNPMRQNRMLTAQAALELGLVDRVFSDVSLLDETIDLAFELVRNGLPERPAVDWTGAGDSLRRARARLDGSTAGAPVAPYRALDLIEGAAAWTVEEGYAREEELVAELLPGPQAQASIYAFDCVERRAKRGVGIPEETPRRIGRVGIAGAGLMATQIATLFLRRLEVPVVLRDLTQERVDEAVHAVRDEIAGLVAKGRYDEGKGRFLASLVSGSTDPGAFAGCDLVLEAVFEELDVKRQVFAEVERVVSPECLLVTNTSSLPVAAMAEGLAHPERVVGLHFFNPVAVLPLVEVVRTPSTDDVALATAWDVTKRLGKRGVVTADAPAFVVNRVLTRMTSVLMTAIENGDPVEETDAAALSLGLPMAPSVLLQMVGPRIANHVLETLHGAWPERFPLSPTLAAWAGGGDEIVRTGDAPLGVDGIREAMLDAIADEVRHILDEGVVAEPADVDTCMLLGAGWPFWLGGVTPYLDASGVSQRATGRTFRN